jgi:hypothetical protein
MLADRVSQYDHSRCDDDLPSAVVQEVNQRVLDSLGSALGALTAAPYRVARQLAYVVNVPHGATLRGYPGRRILPDLAAFANGAGPPCHFDFSNTYEGTGAPSGHSASALHCRICLPPHHRLVRAHGRTTGLSPADPATSALHDRTADEGLCPL